MDETINTAIGETNTDTAATKLTDAELEAILTSKPTFVSDEVEPTEGEDVLGLQ